MPSATSTADPSWGAAALPESFRVEAWLVADQPEIVLPAGFMSLSQISWTSIQERKQVVSKCVKHTAYQYLSSLMLLMHPPTTRLEIPVKSVQGIPFKHRSVSTSVEQSYLPEVFGGLSFAIQD